MKEQIDLFFNNIEELITQSRFEESKLLLKHPVLQEYEKYYSIMSTLYFLDRDMSMALKTLCIGLEKFPYSSDLLYNLAIVFKEFNNQDWAYLPICLSDLKYLPNGPNNFENSSETSKNTIALIGDDSFKGFITNILPWIEKQYFIKVINYKNIMNLSSKELTHAIDNFEGFIIDDVSVLMDEAKFANIIKQVEALEKFIVFKTDLLITLPFEGFKYKVRKSLTKSEIETLVLGLSYAEVGIIESQFKNGCINMALSSQDLYYDNKVLKLFLKNKYFNIKNVILNLAYYSFRYDLSRTFERVRIRRYMPLIQETNNFDKVELLNILNFSYDDVQEDNQYNNTNQIKSKMKFDISLAQKGKKYAEFHSKIGSKKIEDENIKIIISILEFLKENEINCHILICPVTKYYYEHFDSDLKDRFYNIITSNEVAFTGKILDYFDSDLFSEADFWDDSHLNHEGAKKLTNLVKNELNL